MKIVNLICTQERLYLTLFVVALSLFNTVFSASAAEPKNQPRLAVQEQTRTYTDRSAGFSLELPKDTSDFQVNKVTCSNFSLLSAKAL